MTATIANVSGGRRSILRALRRRALAQALPVYLVGGPVRDVLLGEPIKDLDFVVEGDAPALAQRVAQELNGEAVTYPRFGTATVVLGDCRVDVVTARRETYSSPGALPEVCPGSILDDLARRDFSINTLALPLARRRPALLDPLGGVADLAAGVVRALHANSFADDPTRILRAVRYEQRLGFRLEEATLAQMRTAIRDGHMEAVSGDRLRRELQRILEERRPELALVRAAGLGVLAAIHPSLGDEGKDERNDGRILKRLASAGVNPASPLAYLAALAYPVAPGQAPGLVQRLMMPGPWARVVLDTVAVRELEGELAGPMLTPARVYRLVEGRSQDALFAVSRLTGSPLVAQRLDQHLGRLALAAPRLNGRDLLELGVPAGPPVGQLLLELRDARLDGRVTNEAEERELVRRWIISHGGQVENG